MEAVSFSHKEGLLQRVAKLLVCFFTSIALCISLVPTFSIAEAAEQDGLTLAVDYDHNIKCGVPVTFTMTANGGSGNYKYLQNAITIYADGYWQDDADWTRPQYQYTETTTFEYTFVASGNYRMWIHVMDLETFPSQMPKRFEIYVNVNDPDAITVDQKASSIASSIAAKGYKSEYKKALEAHDILADWAEYDHSLVYDGISGVLLRKKGTCESYYRAFELVLKKLGIACERATGNGHVWSCVKLDGKWTQIDLTWDDSESATGSNAFLSHVYFGMTDEIAKMVHSEHKPSAERPCNDLSNNFFVKSGQIKDWSSSAISEIEKRIATMGSGAKEIIFDVDAPYHYNPSVFKAVYPVVAYDISHKDKWAGLDSGKVTATYEMQDLTKGVFHVRVQASSQSQPVTPGPGNSGSTESSTDGMSNAVKPAKTLANGTYKFRSVASKKKYVGVVKASRKAGARVKVLVGKRSKAQKFVVKYDKRTGYYTIKNKKSKKVLSIYGSKAKKGRKLVQYKDKKRLTQRWILTGSAKKGYKLASAANPKLYVEIVKASSKKDSFLRLWTGKSAKSQRFVFFKR